MGKIFEISAMAVYFNTVVADSIDEAIDKFCEGCPYDIDGETIVCEEIDEEVEEEE